jgi:hypothetical protein
VSKKKVLISSASEAVEQLDLSSIAGGSARWYSYSEK